MPAREKKSIASLRKEIAHLKKENARLKAALPVNSASPVVKAPKKVRPIFDKAEKLVGNYFRSLHFEPSRGTIEINKERYVLVRASALSHEFLNTIKELYKERGEDEAFNIGKNILFDVAHVLGMEDAKNFNRRMKLDDPISRMSAGPVHFAYSGWASVDILEGSSPSADESFYLKYHHPYSFEADSWVRAKKKSKTPVCIMSAGYSSGWCEASFGIQLTAVEISCRARGDKNCTFIMAPPHMMEKYLKGGVQRKTKGKVEIPAFLERKKIEERLNASISEKDFLVKEIHHRVKNNLQIISSLLNLQSDSIRDADTKEKFTESIGRVRSIAIVHELLYRSKDLSQIKIKDYLGELVSYVTSAYNDSTKNITVDLRLNVKQRIIDLDRAIPCGIIINELLSNAFKYAFTSKRSGKIIVAFTEKAKQKYELIVADNGSGLPEGIDIVSAQTLGLQLVNSLIEQLDAQLEIDITKGTCFKISFG